MKTLTAPVRWTSTLDLDVGMVDTSRGPMEAATAGAGPAVLLVHGLPGSWRQCVPIAEDLADRFRVVLPSRPGYGATPIGTGRTYEEQADALAALLDAQGIDRCAVVGVSGGGPAAIALAARHHERVGALVMACAMAPHLISLSRAMRFLRLPGVSEAFFPLARSVARRQIARAWTNDTPRLRQDLTPDEVVRLDADPRIREDLLRNALAHAEAPAAIAGQRNDLVQIERVHKHEVDPYPLVTGPSLLLYGTSDTVVTTDHSRFYGGVMPDAELVLFEGAGHLFMLTRRNESSSAIRAFVEEAL
jgi:2-hydroxy-6-oxonona-2,4-dienedioate hydrolase